MDMAALGVTSTINSLLRSYVASRDKSDMLAQIRGAPPHMRDSIDSVLDHFGVRMADSDGKLRKISPSAEAIASLPGYLVKNAGAMAAGYIAGFMVTDTIRRSFSKQIFAEN